MQDTQSAIAAVLQQALDNAREAASLADLREIRVRALGRKAPMSRIRAEMGALGEEERRTIGRLLNDAREKIEAALSAREQELAAAEESAPLTRDRVDVTLPGRDMDPGHPHPLSIVTDRIVDIFVGMGFRVAEGPEVETDWYNFQALNIPPDHPARSMQDTMYVEGTDLVMRTHTSPVQVRAMQAQDPPIYVVVPGRVYRRDPFDASHSPCFQQIEGLAIDRGLSLADLKGTLAAFAREMFGPRQRVRFRPSYFQFTEPSAEVDVLCMNCEGAGCTACGHSGWIEIMGAGMVHPNVLKTVGWDPETWTGWAFGLGVERVAMRALGIRDIRWFYENDTRFLAGFHA
ncbi:MAG: phenylalanine--tRNA ligase subunit alpha [Actinomycetota bacterium]